MPFQTVAALVFDFDGTMIDSDAALVDPFVKLGVAREQISFGHAIAEECDRLGISLDAYVDAYDTDLAKPFPGVDEVVGKLGRWAICSNKHPRSAAAELERLSWKPEIAVYADHFDWAHKGLGPVLELMGLGASDVTMVGDSAGDLRCAEEVGCQMIWAGWNPRVAAADPDGIVLGHPSELLALYR
ncbi:MAG TPA: HAD-IA family hydrolase [Microthrixaceae bacterium]|nr:HAD-IA family hydrolase [Microthrixaceae bacterium]